MKKIMAFIFFFQMLVPFAVAARDEIPRNMIFMDVYLKNKDTGEEISPARFPAGHGAYNRSLEECRQTAKDEAKKLRWTNWDYNCCTGTDNNACVTKVK